MQKKLLHHSILCGLFSISGIIFGMEITDPADPYTFLTLSTDKDFFVFSRSSFDQDPIYNNDPTYNNKESFDHMWQLVGINEYNNSVGDKKKIFTNRICTNIKTSLLKVTDDTNKGTSSFSVITDDNKKINLGSFPTSSINTITVALNKYNGINLSLFKTGCYYPISVIKHNSKKFDIKSKKISENLQLRNTCLKWLSVGSIIGTLIYFFPEKFTSLLQSLEKSIAHRF